MRKVSVTGITTVILEGYRAARVDEGAAVTLYSDGVVIVRDGDSEILGRCADGDCVCLGGNDGLWETFRYEDGGDCDEGGKWIPCVLDDEELERRLELVSRRPWMLLGIPL